MLCVLGRRNQGSFQKQYKHDRKSERTLRGALKNSSQLIQVDSVLLDFQTVLILLLLILFPTIKFHAKIIKQIFLISCLGAALSLIRDSFWDVKNPTRDRVFFPPFGTHLVSTVSLVFHAHWRITLMCFFFLDKMRPSCLCCIYYTVSISYVLSSI